MFFDRVEEIAEIARRTGTAVFVVPDEVAVELPGALVLQPETKTTITIDQVREVLARLSTRQVSERFVLVRPAELLNEEAANAFLKLLEEPGEKVHFVLVTKEPSALLATIRSRAAVYFLRAADDGQIHADARTKEVAKRLMVAKGAELVELAESIAKHKDGVREYALGVIGAAIEMLYKTYFITGRSVFVAKLPKFLAAYEGIARNGHVKLQIVANLG